MEKILSVDIETSSSEMDGTLLSIGLIKVSTGERFYRLAKFRNGLFVKPESMRVNGITLDQLDDKNLPTLQQMDKEIAEWLDKDGEGDKWVPMGRGIGYFDMKFIERDLPRTFGRLTRRVFDLTGFTFGLSQITGKPFEEIRSAALDYATKMMQEDPLHLYQGLGRHHALWDTMHNIHAMNYLITMVI